MPDRYWPMHRIGKEEDVWLAKDVDTDEEVVMKRIERETNSDYYERNEQVHQEAATLKELAELYPQRIIGYRGFYLNDEGYYCLIMDRADCTVGDLLRKHGFFKESDAQMLARALMEGLAFIHSKYIVHRDIKPANLFLLDRFDLDSLKLADFGISAEENGYSNIGGMKGTKGYMAPEILQKRLHGRPVDIWSSGILIHELLLGRKPWIGSPVKPSDRLLHSNIMKEGTISLQARDLLTQMLRADPSQRITAAKALEHPWLREVSPARSSLGRTSRGRTATPSMPPPAKVLVVPEKVEGYDGWLLLWQANGPPYYLHEPTGTTQWHHPGEKPGAPPAWVNPFEHHQSAKVIDATSAASANSGTKVITNTPAATARPATPLRPAAPPPQKPDPTQRRRSLEEDERRSLQRGEALGASSVQSSFAPPSQDASPKRSVTFAYPSTAGSRAPPLPPRPPTSVPAAVKEDGAAPKKKPPPPPPSKPIGLRKKEETSGAATSSPALPRAATSPPPPKLRLFASAAPPARDPSPFDDPKEEVLLVEPLTENSASPSRSATQFEAPKRNVSRLVSELQSLHLAKVEGRTPTR
ncbi:kinase-like domain-containing protein [Zopfochytrium polystomum]|nr:kinase-like domain-containing protein [Zopfochytrium polystomum]